MNISDISMTPAQFIIDAIQQHQTKNVWSEIKCIEVSHYTFRILREHFTNINSGNSNAMVIIGLTVLGVQIIQTSRQYPVLIDYNNVIFDL